MNGPLDCDTEEDDPERRGAAAAAPIIDEIEDADEVSQEPPTKAPKMTMVTAQRKQYLHGAGTPWDLLRNPSDVPSQLPDDIEDDDDGWVPSLKTRKVMPPRLELVRDDDVGEDITAAMALAMPIPKLPVAERKRRTRSDNHIPPGAELPTVLQAKTDSRWDGYHATNFLLFRQYGLEIPSDCGFPSWTEQEVAWALTEYGSDEWQKLRRASINGSDITVIIGTSARSQNSIFKRYRGIDPAPNEFQQFLFDQGHIVERIALMLYEYLVLKPDERLGKAGTMMLKGKPYITVTPDAVVERMGKPEEPATCVRAVECKGHVCKAVQFTTPLENEAQLMFEMAVAGVTEADYVSLSVNPQTLDSTIVVTRVQFSKQYFDMAVAMVDNFCTRLWLGAEGYGSDRTFKRARLSDEIKVVSEQILSLDNPIFQVPGCVAFAKDIMAPLLGSRMSKIATTIGYKQEASDLPQVVDDDNEELL